MLILLALASSTLRDGLRSIERASLLFAVLSCSFIAHYMVIDLKLIDK